MIRLNQGAVNASLTPTLQVRGVQIKLKGGTGATYTLKRLKRSPHSAGCVPLIYAGLFEGCGFKLLRKRKHPPF